MPFDGTQSITFVILISLVSIGCTLYNTWATTKRDTRAKAAESERRAVEYAEIKANLEVIRTDQSETRKTVERTADTLNDMKQTSLQHGFQLENHEKRISALEQKRS